MNKNLKVQVTAQEGKVFIYEGKAPEIKDPKIVNITGTLDAPARWLETRTNTINQLGANIQVNRENLWIRLNLEDKNPFGDTITGKAELHPIFKKFAINTDTYRTPQELAQLFKMNRSHFENQSTAMNLVTTLQNFKAKVSKEIERLNDNRANKTDLTSQVVNSNIPESFTLVIPIFKGKPKVTIQVEIYIKPEDLTCALQSPQANDITETLRDSMIDEVLNAIDAFCPDIVIIEE